MPKGNSFYETVSEAVNAMAETGFTNSEQLEYWTQRLRDAAGRASKSSAQMTQMLRDALEAVYRRLVESGGALKMSPGVSRYTIERVKPQLRAELDRRILASASLIRLNREEAVEKTLRRFQGWATSIPPGGSAEPDKRKTKEDVRKSIAGPPFAERRVLVDQSSKLVASINATVAIGGGAIAAVWKSNYKQPGYAFRPDHAEINNKTYLVRGSWAQEKGLVKPGPDGYADDIVQPAELPFCRCRFLFLFSLRQMPDDMLTVKGRTELERVKVK